MNNTNELQSQNIIKKFQSKQYGNLIDKAKKIWI